jgi:hypothetical protein
VVRFSFSFFVCGTDCDCCPTDISATLNTNVNNTRECDTDADETDEAPTSERKISDDSRACGVTDHGSVHSDTDSIRAYEDAFEGRPGVETLY